MPVKIETLLNHDFTEETVKQLKVNGINYVEDLLHSPVNLSDKVQDKKLKNTIAFIKLKLKDVILTTLTELNLACPIEILVQRGILDGDTIKTLNERGCNTVRGLMNLDSRDPYRGIETPACFVIAKIRRLIETKPDITVDEISEVLTVTADK